MPVPTPPAPEGSGHPVLAVTDVTRRIGGRAILDRVSFALPPAHLTVLVGPNGAGKSTLTAVASGLARPQSGSVTCEGRPLADWPRWLLAAKRIVMGQSGSVAFSFSVEDVVRIGCDGVGRGLAEADRAGIAARAMAVADIAHLAPRDFTTLSGGEQQRARFARALAQLEAGRTLQSRQVLILDEPVASLDLKHQLFLLDEARRLADGGIAVLVVLHDLTLATLYGDTVLVLAAGRIVASGPPKAVLTAALVRDVFEVDHAAAPLLMPWLDRPADHAVSAL